MPLPRLLDNGKPRLAIAMWDFSWLERRWPGAGYEDWGRALDELRERGYDAVRIDAYPLFNYLGSEKSWRLKPQWNVLEWGAPCEMDVTVWPALPEFLRACRSRGIAVGLSTWFRQDVANSRMQVTSPELHAEIWLATLRKLKAEGLTEDLLYVDLCNEWPLRHWAPFFNNSVENTGDWRTPVSLSWMAKAAALVRAEFPGLPLTVSTLTSDGIFPDATTDVSYLDFLEPHIWMAQQRGYYDQVGYRYPQFESSGLELVARDGERIYRERPAYWQAGLTEAIDRMAAFSASSGKPLVTTECWGLVDFRDWPGMRWGWIEELCALGVRHALSKGRWRAVATSNFCGPQFPGHWRNTAWHQELTREIRASG
jgi:hypothetical protein